MHRQMCRQSGKASSEPPDLVPQTGTFTTHIVNRRVGRRGGRTLCLGMKALCDLCSGVQNNQGILQIQEAMMILLFMLIVKFLEALVKGTGIVMGAYK